MMVERSRSSNNELQDALVVAIDFGTTYSGVAWASTKDKTIKTIKAWPGEPRQMEKVKTELTYKAYSGVDSRVHKWGFEVTDHTPNALRWFKLLLHSADCDRLSYAVSSIEGEQREVKLRRLRETLRLLPPDKEPKDVAADYLRLLHSQLKARLQRTYKREHLNKLGKEVPVYYYLTVPAMWSPSAKNLTRAAAKAAGMEEWGPVKLISEPEAAAAHCFMEYQGTPDALKVDDVFVIVDCGGGTVDIISYEVTSTSPLKVKEVAVGTGGMYGSVFLNDRFEDLVRSKIGPSTFTEMSPEAKEEMMAYFETRLKRTFRENKPSAADKWPTDDSNDGYTDCDHDSQDEDDEDDHADTYPCPVPGVPDDDEAGVIAESLTLSADEVKSIFEPIFRGIRDMVQGQVEDAEKNSNRPVTALMLVGGFGSSDYLYEYLSANVKSRFTENITVLQVPEGWQAIVQGAVQHGLSIQHLRADTESTDTAAMDSGFVEVRRVRESYGFSAGEPYKPGIHPREPVVFSPVLGGLLCLGRMQWFIERGAELRGSMKSKEICRITGHSHASSDSGDGDQVQILRSAALVAPAGEEDPSVEPFTSFDIDLSDVPKEVHLSSFFGACFERVCYNLCMKVTEAAEVEFWAEVDGKVLGRSTKVKAKVDD